MNLRPAALFLASVGSVNAAYPSSLAWEDCDQNKCATLEFCKNGSNYGYRNPGDTTPCGTRPGPLIRMTPGTTYKLTLRNTAEDTNLKTNIHTHGLHITGSGDGDDITRFVTGGSCLDYTYAIPSDHPGGTNWYHPHYHTLTNGQTSGGAFGMIIIEDDDTQLDAWARPENELLLLVSDTGSVLGNGLDNEVFKVEAERWYRLRVSTVQPVAATSPLSFNGGVCTVYKVASDGIWHNAPLTTYSGSSFDMTGASRADYAIKCASGLTEIRWRNGVAATIEAGTFGFNTGSTDWGDFTAPPKPASLASLVESVNTTPYGTYSITMSGAKINTKSWDEAHPLGIVQYGEVYEWTIKGSGAHPYHQHLYHMLIVQPGGCGFHQEGEFYDTLSATGNCAVRFYAIDIGQRMVLHCHVLGHEDNGAMVWMDVVGTPESKKNNVDAPAYQCSAGVTPTTPSPSAPPTTSSTPAPTTSATPLPTSSPNAANAGCTTCAGLGKLGCDDCSGCSWSMGSCVGNPVNPFGRALRGRVEQAASGLVL